MQTDHGRLELSHLARRQGAERLRSGLKKGPPDFDFLPDIVSKLRQPQLVLCPKKWAQFRVPFRELLSRTYPVWLRFVGQPV
jgi:hypothetical protein